MPIIRRCKCGKEFLTRPSYLKKGRGKFCSRACSDRYRVTDEVREKLSEAMTGKDRGGSVLHICERENCGKAFTTYRSAVGRYCSDKCRIMSLTSFYEGKKIPDEVKKKIGEAVKDIRWEEILCGHRFRNEWGKFEKCTNVKKRNRKTCGQHGKIIARRFYPFKYNKSYVIDMNL